MLDKPGPVELLATVPEWVTFLSKREVSAVTPSPDIAVISIADLVLYKTNFNEGWHSVQHSYFVDDDYTQELLDASGAEAYEAYFNKDRSEVLRKHIQFLKQVGVKKIIVHCDAGKSRSAAVAIYISESLGIDLYKNGEHIGRDDPLLDDHNVMVLGLLENPRLFKSSSHPNDAKNQFPVPSIRTVALVVAVCGIAYLLEYV